MALVTLRYEYVYLSIYVSMYVYMNLHIYICVSIYLSIYLSFCLCINLRVFVSIDLYVCLHLTFFPVGIKLVLNIRLNRYLSIARQSDKMIRLICVNYADQSSDTAMNSCSPIKLETYLIKTKTNEVR